MPGSRRGPIRSFRQVAALALALAILGLVPGDASAGAPSAAGTVIEGDASAPAQTPVDRSEAVIKLLRQVAAGDDRPAVAGPAAVPVPAPKPVRDRAAGDGQKALSPLGAQAQAGSAGRAPKVGTIAELQRALQARDVVIADLLRRVEQLEQRIVLTDAQLDRAVGGAGPISLRHRSLVEKSAPPAASTPAAVVPDAATDSADASDQAQVAQAQEPAAPAPPPPPAPGQFEVDEALIDRALERTLVQEGVLLLPFGQFEVEPAFQYTRRETDIPVGIGGTVAEGKIKRNEFETGVTVRVGLPFDSQVEVAIPYNVVEEQTNTEVNGVPQNSNSETGKGFGDVSVGLAKTLLQESGGWWPDVIGRVTYDGDTGKTQDNGVFLGSGFNEVSGSLSAVKRQDPLAFVGAVSYSKIFENDDIEPGDELGFSLGTVLAASPETSLSFFFNQTFANDAKINGDTINGSDQVVGTFSIGAATTLGQNVLLSVTGDIGLTDDAPDYAIGASLPIRFNLPID